MENYNAPCKANFMSGWNYETNETNGGRIQTTVDLSSAANKETFILRFQFSCKAP